MSKICLVSNFFKDQFFSITKLPENQIQWNIGETLIKFCNISLEGFAAADNIIFDKKNISVTVIPWNCECRTGQPRLFTFVILPWFLNIHNELVHTQWASTYTMG